MVIRETDHWITFDFVENSGEGFAMWKASGVFYEMHEHAVDDEPIEIKPLRPGRESLFSVRIARDNPPADLRWIVGVDYRRNLVDHQAAPLQSVRFSR